MSGSRQNSNAQDDKTNTTYRTGPELRMAKKDLSDRQKNILKYIAEYIDDNTRPPTIREIGSAVKITSTSVVNYNLQRLKERDLLARDAEVSRGLRLTDAAYKFLGISRDEGAFLRIPLVGNIAAGEPISIGDDAYDPEDDAIELSHSMMPGGHDELYALKVSGDSMIDAMVNDGDTVVLRRQTTAKNGDMVAAWITPDDETTLKYYFYENDMVRLQPANPTMDPIYVKPEHVQVHGRVEMVIRQL